LCDTWFLFLLHSTVNFGLISVEEYEEICLVFWSEGELVGFRLQEGAGAISSVTEETTLVSR
jgi:hypothetical protein